MNLLSVLLLNALLFAQLYFWLETLLIEYNFCKKFFWIKKFLVAVQHKHTQNDCQTHIDTQTDSLERLKALLRSSRVSFMKSFFAEGGLEALLTTIEVRVLIYSISIYQAT